MNATPAAPVTTDAPKAGTDGPKVEAAKATPTASKTPAKKAAPAKKATAGKAPAKKATPSKKAAAPVKKAAAPVKKAAPKKEAAPKVMASTDANHQQWKVLKRDLTSVMSDLLYDSRRVNPDHSKSQAEATAKVSSALKVLSEFADNIRLK